MKYMGGKYRIAKYIVPIIQSYIDKSGFKVYLEPFCGGCSIIEHIKADSRHAMDIQPYLIELFRNLSRLNELPEFVTKEHYDEVRNCYNRQWHIYQDWYIGAIGFLASYNGRFFDGGYAGIVETKDGKIRNYYAEAKRNLEKQAKKLRKVGFFCDDYTQMIDVEGCVIYCDPPYQNRKQYGINKKFNSEEFWEWVRDRSSQNIIIVSETKAPEDFICIWEQPVFRTINSGKSVPDTEKLFIYGQGIATQWG